LGHPVHAINVYTVACVWHTTTATLSCAEVTPGEGRLRVVAQSRTPRTAEAVFCRGRMTSRVAQQTTSKHWRTMPAADVMNWIFNYSSSTSASQHSPVHTCSVYDISDNNGFQCKSTSSRCTTLSSTTVPPGNLAHDNNNNLETWRPGITSVWMCLFHSVAFSSNLHSFTHTPTFDVNSILNVTLTYILWHTTQIFISQ